MVLIAPKYEAIRAVVYRLTGMPYHDEPVCVGNEVRHADYAIPVVSFRLWSPGGLWPSGSSDSARRR